MDLIHSIRRAVLVALLLGIVVTLACAGARSEVGGGQPAETVGRSELVPVTLMLDWVPNVNHVGIFVARDAGFFANQGLDVSIVEPGEVYATTAVVGGKAEFGVDFQENVTMLRTDDVPIVSIAAILQTNTSGFAVRSGEGIATPADFEGLTYGTFNSPFEEPTLSTLVRCAGGSPETISYVTAGTDLLAMLQQGLADIVWIFYGTQGFQAQRIGLHIDYFALNSYPECIPDYYSPVIIASEQTLRDRPDVTRRFLAALDAAHRYVVDHPQEAAAILAAAVPELDAAELTQSVPWLARRMIMDSQWGHQDLSIWRDYGEWMRDAGVLDGDFEPEAAFTNSFLPAP